LRYFSLFCAVLRWFAMICAVLGAFVMLGATFLCFCGYLRLVVTIR